MLCHGRSEKVVGCKCCFEFRRMPKWRMKKERTRLKVLNNSNEVEREVLLM